MKNALLKNLLHIFIDKNFIGSDNEIKYYLIYNGKGKNDLDKEMIKKLKLSGKCVVYADRCLVDEDELNKLGIIFRQIPYEIKVY